MKSGCKDKLLHIVHATNKYREYVSQQQKQLQLEETLFSSIIEPTSGYEMQPSVLHKESIENGDLIEFEWNGENLRGCVIDTNIDNLERYIKLTKFDLRFMKQQRLLQNPLLEEKQINIIAQYELFKETEDILNIPNLVIRRFIEINNGVDIGYYNVYICKLERVIQTHTVPDIATLIGKIIERIKNNFPSKKWPSIKVNNQLAGIAGYTEQEHLISVNLSRMKNFAINEFVKHGISIEQTTQMVLAHELGHADLDSLSVLDENYYNIIKELEKIEAFKDLNSDLFFTQASNLEVYKNECLLGEKCIDIVLKNEMNAFKNGLKYVEPFLQFHFQKINYENYKIIKFILRDEIFKSWSIYYHYLKSFESKPPV